MNRLFCLIIGVFGLALPSVGYGQVPEASSVSALTIWGRSEDLKYCIDQVGAPEMLKQLEVDKASGVIGFDIGLPLSLARIRRSSIASPPWGDVPEGVCCIRIHEHRLVRAYLGVSPILVGKPRKSESVWIGVKGSKAGEIYGNGSLAASVLVLEAVRFFGYWSGTTWNRSVYMETGYRGRFAAKATSAFGDPEDWFEEPAKRPVRFRFWEPVITPVDRSRTSITALAYDVRDLYVQSGVLSLDRGKLRDSAGYDIEFKDDWGFPIRMIKDGDMLVIASFGSDGLPGGVGDRRDLIHAWRFGDPDGSNPMCVVERTF